MSDFDVFWAAYPRRTAKFAAQKAYARARTVASAAEILAGVEAYKRRKPEYADWCHPATFLNQGRWMDEDDAPSLPLAPSVSDDWFHECQTLHGGSCGGSLKHRTRMVVDQQKAKGITYLTPLERERATK